MLKCMFWPQLIHSSDEINHSIHTHTPTGWLAQLLIDFSFRFTVLILLICFISLRVFFGVMNLFVCLWLDSLFTKSNRCLSISIIYSMPCSLFCLSYAVVCSIDSSVHSQCAQTHTRTRTGISSIKPFQPQNTGCFSLSFSIPPNVYCLFLLLGNNRSLSHGVFVRVVVVVVVGAAATAVSVRLFHWLNERVSQMNAQKKTQLSSTSEWVRKLQHGIRCTFVCVLVVLSLLLLVFLCHFRP